MEPVEGASTSPSCQLGRTADRLSLYQNQLAHHQTAPHWPRSEESTTPKLVPMARDPVTCHVLNTLTGTPAANLPVTLTLLSPIGSNQNPISFQAATDSDGRVKSWTTATAASGSTSVAQLLSSLPSADSKTNWAVRFQVGPWYESQGVESFWPEVEVKFTVKGRGVEGEEGWKHYHVPVLLGPWNYSTYRGS